MEGKGYISVVAAKEFNFGSFLDNLREYFDGERSADLLHDLVNQFIGIVQTLMGEINLSEFRQSHAFEALAYGTLAGFFLKEYEKFNDREYSERRDELARAWSQLMEILKDKGVEDTIPFPY
ncbi:MAG TPA: hypothetical protein VGV59_12655 [Pyrinomonadaceae bacterium]|nr:hypothetical protein [Pyrinomonadaceae bacterium]